MSSPAAASTPILKMSPREREPKSGSDERTGGYEAARKQLSGEVRELKHMADALIARVDKPLLGNEWAPVADRLWSVIGQFMIHLNVRHFANCDPFI